MNIRALIQSVIAVLLSVGLAMPAGASYLPFNTNVHMNVGIGSTNPGQSLDVQGTVRALYFSGNGSGLTNLPGTTQWTTTNTNDVYLPSNGNVGLGTTLTTTSALTVMNGNIGIGTWVPGAPLSIVLPGGSGANAIQVISGGVTYFSVNPAANGISAGQLNASVDVATNTLQEYGGASRIQIAPYGEDVGIGTNLANDTLDIMSTGTGNGNVGIGTWIAKGALDIKSGNNVLVENGNVGISSLNPGQLLDVQGTLRVLGSGSVGIGTSSTSTSALTVMNGNVGIGTWVPADTFQVGAFKSSSSGFEVDANGNVGIGTTKTTTSALTIMNGNVGIGTWVPGAVLQIYNPADTIALYISMPNESTQNAITMVGNAPNYSSLLGGKLFGVEETGDSVLRGMFYADGSYAMGNGGASRDLFVYREAANVFEIDKDHLNGKAGLIVTGNIGIGTTNGTLISPNASLSIIGNIGIGTVANGDNFLTTAPPTGGMIIEKNVGIGSTNPGQLLDVQGTVRALYFSGNGSQLTGISSSQWTTTNTNDVYLPSNGNVGLGTTITSAGAALTVMNGNVGIGTWKPGGVLEVEGGNVSIGTQISTSKLDVVGIGPQIKADSNAGGSVGSIRVADGYNSWDFGINISSLGSFDFYDNSASATRVTFLRGGNVGIGTTNPQGALTVMNGNVGIGTWVPINGLALEGNATIGAAAGYLDSANAAPSNGLLVQGNVGIGTWVTSGNKLSVVGGNIYTSNVFVAGAGGSYFPGQVSVNGTLAVVSVADYSTGNYYVTMGSSSTSALLKSNVGIGTFTAPSARLLVDGNVGIGTSGAYLTSTPPTGGMFVQGNVGIGSVNPGQMLDVQGTVRATTFIGNGAQLTGISASQWTTTNTNDVYLPSNGNVGIGTTLTTTSALTVMNGNVGIGTWVPATQLDMVGNLRMGQGTTASCTISDNPLSAGASTINVNSTANFPASGFLGLNYNGTTEIVSYNGLTATSFTNVVRGLYGTTAASHAQNQQVVLYQFITGPNTTSTPSVAMAYYSGQPDILIGQAGRGGNSYGLVAARGTFTSDVDATTYTGAAGGGVYIRPASFLHIEDNSTVNVDIAYGGGNLGIGTEIYNNKLSVLGGAGFGSYATSTAPAGGIIASGNVGIGTFNPFGGGLIVLPANTGNVGIGSVTPGQALDVQGTLRVLGGGTVGIGTSLVSTSALTVMSGNVGIGTWVPSATMQVTGQYFSTKYTTTTTLDWNNGNVQYIVLANGAQTFTFANPKGGARYMLIVKQPSSGAAGTVTWPGTVLWPGGTAPTLTTTNSKADVITFAYDDTNTQYYGGSSLNY